MSIINLDTPQALEKALFLQKLLSRQAKRDLDDIAQKAVMYDSVYKLKHERILLENYANGPTLTEFKLMPSTFDSTRWGATFGVTVLVQSLIIDRADISHKPDLQPLLRPLLLVLVNELSNPQSKSLLDPLKDALKFSIKMNGEELTGTTRDSFIQSFLQGIVESFISAMHEYSLVRLVQLAGNQGWQITPLGQRVYLHLMDARKFLEAVTEAHVKLQAVKPNLSMV